MKHREDLFPHSNFCSESYLISFAPASIFKMYLSLFLFRLTVLSCSVTPCKERPQTFLINNVPAGKHYLFYLFLVFPFTCSSLRSMNFNSSCKASLSEAVTLPQWGQQHQSTVMFIKMNCHEDDIQLHIYCTVLAQNKKRVAVLS